MADDDDDNGAAGGAGKDGLKAAIDVTKYTLAVSGAAIAFLLSSDMLKTITNSFSKTAVTLALMGFGVSAIAGLLVLLQGATNLANADYDLGQSFIKYPGIANIVGLIVGFFFATIFIISQIWH